VYRAAVVYAVVALAVVEAADMMLPRLGFADSAVTFIVVVALLGLPPALVLAWAYESTPEGMVRTKPVDAPAPPPTRRMYGAAAGALVLVVGVGWWLLATLGTADFGQDEPGAAIGSKSIAVLPFRDMSPTGDQQWFSEGLAEEILGALARVPDLRVVARQSSFALADAAIGEIGDRLGVTHVLLGSVRTEGNRAIICDQLTEVERQTDLWSRDFRPELTSVLDAQEEIARAVVDALEVELGSIGEDQLMMASTESPFAHEE
jgi:TolB-like protein